MERLESEVLYVKFIYVDNSELIFKGTRNISFIKSCNSEVLLRDVFDSNTGKLLPDLVYDLKSETFRIIPQNCKVEVSNTEMTYLRRLDKFASRFI